MLFWDSLTSCQIHMIIIIIIIIIITLRRMLFRQRHRRFGRKNRVLPCRTYGFLITSPDALPLSHRGLVGDSRPLNYNTRHKSLKQEPFVLNFSKFLTFTLHTFVLTQMCPSPSPMLSRAYFGALKWLQTQINIGEGKITHVFQDLWRGL